MNEEVDLTCEFCNKPTNGYEALDNNEVPCCDECYCLTCGYGGCTVRHDEDEEEG